MTRKELVKLLEASYGENEEVFVKYDDEQGDYSSGVSGIEDFTQTYVTKMRWEKKNDQGEWHEISKQDALRLGGCRNDHVRYVILERKDITRKCIVIKH